MSCSDDLDSYDFAKIFMEEVFRLHGLPSTIITDRGTQFINSFFSRLCYLLHIDHTLSTAFHQRTNCCRRSSHLRPSPLRMESRARMESHSTFQILSLTQLRSRSLSLVLDSSLTFSQRHLCSFIKAPATSSLGSAFTQSELRSLSLVLQ